MNINEYRGTCPRKSTVFTESVNRRDPLIFERFEPLYRETNGGGYTKRRIEAISRNQLAVAVVIARLRAP